jgi:taurine dioxygenase
VRHPGVVVHPYTKEKFIYGSRGFVVGIADRGPTSRLLSARSRLCRERRFIREVQWSMGDIIIWDNRFLQHSSGRNPGPEEETMMYRITLQDGLPLCASQMQPKAAVAERLIPAM